jgi:phosphate butyryltransferase
MELKNFDELIAQSGGPGKTVRGVIANSASAHVMEFLEDAKKAGLPMPLLVGDKKITGDLLEKTGEDPGEFTIVGCPAGEEAQTAVDLVNEGKADFLMKGMMETSDFLRPIVKKENGLRSGPLMSYVALASFADYPKLLLCTDGGMVTYPDYEKKKQIALNAAGVLHALGYTKPKIAVLCCKETVDEKMPETLDAARLREASLAGELGECAVEGPISYDICMSPEIAAVKGFKSEHSGNFDILLLPNIHACNIFVKSLVIHSKAKAAGIIAGCKVPVIAPSRGSTPEEQILSLALATVVSGNKERR